MAFNHLTDTSVPMLLYRYFSTDASVPVLQYRYQVCNLYSTTVQPCHGKTDTGTGTCPPLISQYDLRGRGVTTILPTLQYQYYCTGTSVPIFQYRYFGTKIV